MKDELEAKEFIEMARMANAIWEQYGIYGLKLAQQMADEHERALKELLVSHTIVNKADEAE